MEEGIIKKDLYIYGLVPNHYDDEQFKKLNNIGVIRIPFQEISAIVSQKDKIDLKQLNTEELAELMVHHQKTVESLMNMGFNTIIPMRLGTFTNSSTELIRILKKEYEIILDTTAKVTDLIEVEIVSTYADFGQIIAGIAVHPKVIEMKRNAESNKLGITQDDQLSIGYLVKNLLDELKAKYATTITETFQPLCTTLKQHELMNDQMVSNTAFLIPKSKFDLFEQKLDQLDETLLGKFNFKLVGPLPCYSFYTMELKSICLEEIESAQKELELDNSTSEKNIQQAYLNKAKFFHPDSNSGEDTTIIFNQIKKAHKTLLDYIDVIKPASKEEYFSLNTDTVIENSLFLKIKE
jgi:hypothetical protein